MTTEKKWEGVRLSPSAVNSYLQCPRDFYYRYVLRLPQPPQVQLIRGTIVHEALESFFDAYPKGGDLSAHMDSCLASAYAAHLEEWNQLKLSDEESAKELSTMRKQLALFQLVFQMRMDIMIDSGKADNPRHAYMSLRPKFREQWFEDKELKLCGYVDRIHEDWGGKVTISDYKTSTRYGTGLKDEYLLQCGIYALLYARQYGKPPNEVSIIYLRYGEEVVTTVTPALVQKALETVEYVHGKTKTDNIENYPCSQHHLCSYSPWFNRKSGICEYEDKVIAEKAVEEILKEEEKQ